MSLAPSHSLFPSKTHLKTPFFFLSNPCFFQIPKTQSFKPSHTQPIPLRAFKTDQNGTFNTFNFNFDSFLQVAEFLCLVSSAVILGVKRRVCAWQFVVLVGGVAIGAVIRNRQWGRVCRGLSGVNLVGRVDKMEEDLRSSATIIRVLSRQIEKLGIRFRVTRKALKEPISETAALAQKNSEATRALAAQEDMLEKELGEIQKVLLAMQEQQQKQLELIIAIGKSGKLWEDRRGPNKDQDKTETSNSTVHGGFKQMEPNQIQALAGQTEGNNDRV